MPFVPKTRVFALREAGTIRRCDLPSTPQHASSAEGPIRHFLSWKIIFKRDNTYVGCVFIGCRSRMGTPAEKILAAYYASVKSLQVVWARKAYIVISAIHLVPDIWMICRKKFKEVKKLKIIGDCWWVGWGYGVIQRCWEYRKFWAH